MKVLMVNKFFRPFGGPESIIRQTMAALERHGHETLEFAMQHPDNWESEWSDYFVSNVDYKKGSYGPLRQAAEAMRIVYSTEARRKIESIVAKTHPDLCHMHNIYHQISPSIIPALKKAGVATVLSIHDGKLLCPEEHFLRGGEVCELCNGSRFYNCFKHTCIKGSRAKSLLCTIEMYIHRLTGIYSRNVDIFLATSEFYRQRMIKAGIAPPERIAMIFNPVDTDIFQPTDPGDYALYMGRIDRHKGVLTLVKAMEQCPDVTLKMVGTGDAVDECNALIQEHKIRNVELVGFKTGDALADMVKGASFLVTPSEWYENCPMVVEESAAYGKPAVITRIGGMQELVDDGKTGFIVEPCNPDELAAKINLLGTNPDMVREMGRNARQKAEEEFSHEAHYEKLIEVYNRACELAAAQ